MSKWGINSNGPTYGVANNRGTPDLVVVIASDGRVGYAYNRQLNPPGPTTLQTRPEPVAPRMITVYTSDGYTQIEVFVRR